MSAFSQKYPATASLIMLVATVGQDAAAQNVTLAQKLESLVNLAGPVVQFLPLSSSLGAELALIKQSPTDIELAGEELVSDLNFSSAHAKAIVAAALPVAEDLAGMVGKVEALMAAVKTAPAA